MNDNSKSRPHCIYAEFALTPRQHEAGLMGRKHLRKNHGMLFDFGKEKDLSFWMANTYVPLQIAFVDKKGKIGKIANMTPLSTRSIKSDGRYRYALEVNEGWFDKHNIQVGAQVSIPGTENQELPDIQDETFSDPELDDPTMDTEQEQAEQTEQQPPRPDVVIQRSHKDVLNEISNYPSGFKVKIEYITKDGHNIPMKTIETPFEFSDTSGGETDGLVTAWDSQKARFSSFIIDNVLTIRDYENENIISTNQQIAEAFGKLPMNERDEQSVIGIMSRPNY
jgi:uncharacterized membrane protein (UPF0127 family)